MSQRRFFPAFKFRDDRLGQALAQLDAPLVERVDAPDRALRKDVVLVKGDETTEGFRGEPVGKNRVRRAIALEDTVGRQPIRGAFCLDLLPRLADRKRLALGKHVRQQDVVVLTKRVQ